MMSLKVPFAGSLWDMASVLKVTQRAPNTISRLEDVTLSQDVYDNDSCFGVVVTRPAVSESPGELQHEPRAGRCDRGTRRVLHDAYWGVGAGALRVTYRALEIKPSFGGHDRVTA
jgi:hypothetical protein